MKKWIIGILMLLFIGNHVWANEVRISLKELPQALKTVSSGDTIYIKSGIYTNLRLEIQNQRFDANVVVRPVNFGVVTIQKETLFFLTHCSHLKFEGFYFTHTAGSTFILNGSDHITIANNYFYRSGIRPAHSVIRIVKGSSDNLIYRNTFDQLHSQGILIATYPDNPMDKYNIGNTIRKNYFCNIPAVKRIYPGLPRNGMEAIVIGFGGDKTRPYKLHTSVEENLFEKIIGDGNEIISNKTSANAIVNNTFRKNRSGLTIRAGNYDVVKYNYFYRNKNAIRVYGYGHLITHNLIVDSKTAIVLPNADFYKGQKHTFVGYNQADSVTIAHNIIVNYENAGIVLGRKDRRLSPENIFLRDNKIYGTQRSALTVSPKAENISRKSNYLYFSTAKIVGNKNQNIIDAWQNSVQNYAIKVYQSNDDRVGCTWKRPIILPWKNLMNNN